MADPRVVVSGLGAVSPYGAGVKALWTGLSSGVTAIRPATAIDTDGLRARIAAEVPAEALDGLGVSRRRSRADRMAIAAAAEALSDAGVGAGDRVGAALLVGAVGGGMYEAEEWYWSRRTPSDRDRRALRSLLPTAHADALAARFGICGPRETLVMACASGAASIALAADLIRDGVVDVALAGGVDSLTRVCFMGFNALKLVDPEPCRPFDRGRRGMSVGEAAAFVVLEAADRCRARGGRAYAELAGAAMTTDAHHVTAPHPEGEGMIRAMSLALAAAHVAPAEIDYVNAHGTGTPVNDSIEALALARVFDGATPLVSASKSLIGHAMAAAGSVEAVATILAMCHGLVPPTANLVDVDPAMPFDCVPGTARPAVVETALSNSFGFGGQNVSLVFRRNAD